MELQFLIFINTDASIGDVVSYLVLNLSNANISSYRSLKWKNNWIQIWNNDDYDPSRIHEQDDGFLYYKYRIEVSPMGKHSTLNQQINIARILKTNLENFATQVVVAADFEDCL